MAQAPELAGGAGFTFEDVIAAQYLTALLCEGHAPGIADRKVVRVALQQRDFGEPLDDVIIDFQSIQGNQARLSLQIKRSITISNAKSNKDFREIVRDSWATLQKPNFREGIDRFGGATDSVAMDKSRALDTLCEIARASPTSADFDMRFAEAGNASIALKTVKEHIASLLQEQIGDVCPPAMLHRFLSHFLLLQFDYPNAAAVDPSTAINSLQGVLANHSTGQAPLVWDRLCRLAREGAGKSEQFVRASVVRAISSLVRLRGGISFQGDLDTLRSMTTSSILDVEDRVGSTRLERPKLTADLDEKLGKHRFVQIHGLPGAGKSVLLRRRAEIELKAGPTLFLKSDRLEGRSWSSFASIHGLTHRNLADLLVELEAVGSKIFFVDGIDRIEKQHRAIVTDVITEILRSPLLVDWRVVVSLRDSGIEPLRNWLPAELFEGEGVGTVEVSALDDTEAKILSKEQPALKPLLFGAKPVQEIVRRPFFARILSQNFAAMTGAAEFIPRSEVDLIENWWTRGGYDSEGLKAIKRQRALLELSAYRSHHLSEPIAFSAMSVATIEMIEEFRTDGILQDVRPGHSVRFSHDIFFEWAFFHRLVDQGTAWLNDLRNSGEPPVIGRVVELLSQAEFVRGDNWSAILTQVEKSGMRSQWTRAWLLAPIGASNFVDFKSRFAIAVKADGWRLLQRALVWFQAERTIPNPNILDKSHDASQMSRDERIRAADLLAWPSDFEAWGRFLSFVLAEISNLPRSLASDIIGLFQVWQNALADLPNPLSHALLIQCDSWLREIEQSRTWTLEGPLNPSLWKSVDHDLKDLEQSLRRLLLRAARTAPDLAGAYIERLKTDDGLLDRVFDEVMHFAPVLAETHAPLLADVTLIYLMEELPEDRAVREEREAHATAERVKEALAKPPAERSRDEELMADGMFSVIGHGSFSHMDWEALAVERNPGKYFPASPLSEPFHSLFSRAPDDALRVFRSLNNHAVTAWRQLYRLDSERSATPIPLSIEFPWGTQQFWGGRREYLWSRGIWAPKPLACAYLALETWCFQELERGRKAEDLIRQIVVGNDSIAILGTVVAIALHTRLVSDVVQPLIESQRLWRADHVRFTQEVDTRAASTIGFSDPSTAHQHLDAIATLNQRAVRQFELRDLVTLYVLSSDNERAEGTRSAILAFETDLPFEYEEQRNSVDIGAELALDAKTNMEWAEKENFRLMAHPNDETQSAIVHVSPQAATPEAHARRAEARTRLNEIALFQWAETSFEVGVIPTHLSVADAASLAQDMDNPELFSSELSEGDLGIRRGAVAGTAAVILAFRDRSESGERVWARQVISRALKTPEKADGLWESANFISWHPCIFAARALAADLGSTDAGPTATTELLNLVAHPLECVRLAALKEILSLWKQMPRFAWCGLSAGLSLCLVERESAQKIQGLEKLTSRAKRRLLAVKAAADAFAMNGYWPDLPAPPPAWTEVKPGDTSKLIRRPRHRPRIGIDTAFDEDEEFVRWREPDTSWHSQLAAKILAFIPVDHLMTITESRVRFESYRAVLLAWTIEKIAPSWDRSGRQPNRSTASLIEWRRELCAMLGRVAGYIDASEVKVSILDPISALKDDPCFSLLSPFIDSYVRQHVFDAVSIAPSAKQVLELSLGRLLKASVFDRRSHRAGSLHGWDLPSLLDSFFFVSVEHAPGAARFANGDWREIDFILPIVDRFIRQSGWSWTVMSRYMKLCDRARDAYPSDLFVEQVLSLIQLGSDGLSDWRGTLLAARIAGLVQYLADREAPMPAVLAQKFLRILDFLVDFGDRRSAALQLSDAFREVRVA